MINYEELYNQASEAYKLNKEAGAMEVFNKLSKTEVFDLCNAIGFDSVRRTQTKKAMINILIRQGIEWDLSREAIASVNIK